MKPICYIVGAAPTKTIIKPPRPEDLIISADAGYLTLKEQGLHPDIAVGDFDTAPAPTGVNTVVLPSVKDDTDTVYAVKTGLEHGYERFLIYGALGGSRFSHSFATVQTLTYILDRGGRAVACGDGYAALVLRCGRVDFRSGCSGFFSVFSLDTESRGVSVSGAKYNITDVTLTNSFPLGVSNEFTGKATGVSVCDGTLLVIYECTDPLSVLYEW